MISPTDQARLNQTVKIVLAGAHNVGKTMILWKWNEKDEPFQEKPTIGTDFCCREVNVKGKVYRIHLWDTAGQETYHAITGPYFRSSNGVVLVFDITQRESFDNLNYWFKMIEDNTKDPPIIVLLANKADMRQPAVTDTEIEQFCAERKIKYFKTSALTGYRISEAFHELIDDVIKNDKSHKYDSQPIQLIAGNNSTKKCC